MLVGFYQEEEQRHLLCCRQNHRDGDRDEEEKSWVCRCKVSHPGAQVHDKDHREARQVRERCGHEV